MHAAVVGQQFRDSVGDLLERRRARRVVEVRVADPLAIDERDPEITADKLQEPVGGAGMRLRRGDVEPYLVTLIEAPVAEAAR
jgi:hypothetical protein